MDSETLDRDGGKDILPVVGEVAGRCEHVLRREGAVEDYMHGGHRQSSFKKSITARATISGFSIGRPCVASGTTTTLDVGIALAISAAWASVIMSLSPSSTSVGACTVASSDRSRSGSPDLIICHSFSTM